MQTAPAENDAKVRKLIEAARKEPVLVLDNGEPAAVAKSGLTEEELNRLLAGDS
jgi:PHD/YefM family antitoxin component YafN of YafNO toxin-antitoxin module